MDLDGDGVELVSLDESAAFYDINADGYLYNLGWAAADDGLLAYDKNNDGVINRKNEISFVDYVPGARTDLEGLRHFDSNGDGVLDSSDAEFAKFKVWRDANQDGTSDAGELRTLTEARIRSIELNYAPGDDGQPETRAGNTIAGEGIYRKTNGATGVFADAAFATGAFGFRVNGDNLEFKSADDADKIYVAPPGASAVRMDFAAAANAAHIGAIGGDRADVLNGNGVSRDLLLSGGAGADRLTGGSGSDWLDGGAGADTLRGGDGHDVLFFDRHDNVHGGAGYDVGIVAGDAGSLSLFINQTGLEALFSGDGNDRLDAFDSTQDVIIDGGGGNDYVRGNHQNNILSGGDGDDYIKGHKGDDILLGGDGADTMDGNRGNDILLGGQGDDHLSGLIDNDRLEGGAGADILHGGDGDDFIKGNTGDDVLLGGDGADTLLGNIGDDVLFGGEGDDYLNGLLGDDTLEGGQGSDNYFFNFPDFSWGDLQRSHSPDFGSDTIRDSGGMRDVVDLLGIKHEDVWLSRHGDDLKIDILGTGEEVTVEDQFASPETRIEYLHVSAETLWSYYGGGRHVSIDSLVNAMSAFDKPQAGWSSMSAQERANIHAAWNTVGIAPTSVS